MSAYLLSLELENVRCFGPRQRLDLSDGHGRPARWTVILGNNGTGKTTLLQAMAELVGVLTDPWYMAGFSSATHPFGWMQRSQALRSEGEIWFTVLPDGLTGTNQTSMDGLPPIKFIVAKGVLNLDPLSGLSMLCCAYGASRRMGSGTLLDSGRDNPRESLFSDDASLRNAEEWLLQSDYVANKASPLKKQAQARLDQVKSILVAVLPEVDDLRVTTITNVLGQLVPLVEARTPYGWVPLRELGLGYRTMIAWMVDFASRLFERYPDSPDPLAEPAVALIDEIDLHLHPRWQRQLLTYLSDRFPNTQFIATAHSPLVVQAASEANLVVLRREGDHVVIDNQPASVAGWRVDQILTSSLFDLPSARPPALDRDLERRKELLARARLTAKEREELRAIAARIGELPTGETPEDIEAMDIIRRAARKLEDGEPKTP